MCSLLPNILKLYFHEQVSGPNRVDLEKAVCKNLHAPRILLITPYIGRTCISLNAIEVNALSASKKENPELTPKCRWIEEVGSTNSVTATTPLR